MRTAVEAPADSPAKDTENAAQDPQVRLDDSEAGLSANTNDDGPEVGEGRSSSLADIALEGVVFMVYAKRL